MNSPFLPASETRWICERAAQLGFALFGVAPAEKFPELLKYPEWLERGYAGEMQYLNDPRRLDPQNAMSGVRSLIVCALNYNSSFPYSTEAAAIHADGRPRGWISRYAWGDDYHEVLWEKLNQLVGEMKMHFAQVAPFEARAYADTGPIHERAAAKYAGLGWLGKNTLLINQRAGSWMFIGTILTTLPLEPTVGANEMPPPDRCGTCRACIEACPTEAIVEPYVLDASRCIAYLTIEFRGAIAENLREAMGRHVFGCDICQDVCPWNRKSPRTDAAAFQPRAFASLSGGQESLFLPDLAGLANLSEEEFRQDFRGSPIKRTKWRGLVRNACIALGNSGLKPGSVAYQEALSTLRRLSNNGDPSVSESARWALSRIQRQGTPPSGR
jgi:epoxyqueuosine reductase